MWRVVSHLNPNANDLYLLCEHTRALSQGLTITKVRYDHRSGRFTAPRRVSPSRFVLVVGLHPFYLKRMREMLDVRIYLEPEEELRRSWKRDRDVRLRGYREDQVVEQIREREADAQAFIRPQRQFADVLVRCFRGETSGALGVDVQTDNGVPLDLLAERLREAGAHVQLRQEDDLVYQTLSFEGAVSEQQIASVARECIPQVNELLATEARWSGGHNGVIQLCFLAVLSDRLRENINGAA
jgi:hypothetical protein